MLKQGIGNYLAVRRSLGFKLDTTQQLLLSFADYAAARGDKYIVSETAIDWAGKTSTAHQRHRRLQIVITFARFVHTEDEHHEIPLNDAFVPPRARLTPYIFSDDELLSIVKEARKLKPSGSIRPHTYSTLYGLLAVTGLRIAEALALRINDVTGDGLVIRNTKFRKNRLVPLHGSVAKAIDAYLVRRLAIVTEHDFLFASVRRTALCYASAWRTFRELCDRTGIPRQPYCRRPRLHDMRHTVAVNMLTNCPLNRSQVTPHMLAVTTYLGHGTPRETFWYLQSTPQLMQDINSAGERWMLGGDQ